jgi:CHAD domain-containing protein
MATRGAAEQIRGMPISTVPARAEGGGGSVAKPTEIPGLGPDTPLAVAGPLLVRGRLDDVRRFEAALARDGEPDMDAVHDMRIATRRLRAAIALFGRGDLAALEDEVKALQDALGEVRDGQVQRRWFARRAEKGAEDGALAEWAGAGLPKASKRLRRALRAWQGAVAPTVARAAPDAAAKGKLQGKRLAKELRARLRTLKRRLAAAREEPSALAAHQLRIAAKKLRYLAELVHPGFPGPAERMLEALVPLQERLGDLHDTDVRIERLEGLARRALAASGVARATLGSLRKERAARAGAAPRARAVARRAARPGAPARALASARAGRGGRRCCRARPRERPGTPRRVAARRLNAPRSLEVIAGEDASPRRYRRARSTWIRVPKTVRKSGPSRATSHSSRSTGPRVRARTFTTPFLWAVRTETIGWWWLRSSASAIRRSATSRRTSRKAPAGRSSRSGRWRSGALRRG